MSRLGDLILLERTRQKLTRKQVARKCGVSEGYIKDVEEGRRIIQDDQARRILKTLGTSQRNEAEFSLDEIAATVDLGTLAPAKPAPQKAEAPKPAPKPASAEEQSGIWLDALSSVLQPVPIMNAGFVQIGRRMLPIQDGKIEGAKPERVLYFQAPDDSMRAMRIEKGDLAAGAASGWRDHAGGIRRASLSAPHPPAGRFENSAAKRRSRSGCSGHAHQRNQAGGSRRPHRNYAVSLGEGEFRENRGSFSYSSA